MLDTVKLQIKSTKGASGITGLLIGLNFMIFIILPIGMISVEYLRLEQSKQMVSVCAESACYDLLMALDTQLLSETMIISEGEINSVYGNNLSASFASNQIEYPIREIEVLISREGVFVFFEYQIEHIFNFDNRWLVADFYYELPINN